MRVCPHSLKAAHQGALLRPFFVPHGWPGACITEGLTLIRLHKTTMRLATSVATALALGSIRSEAQVTTTTLPMTGFPQIFYADADPIPACTFYFHSRPFVLSGLEQIPATAAISAIYIYYHGGTYAPPIGYGIPGQSRVYFTNGSATYPAQPEYYFLGGPQGLNESSLHGYAFQMVDPLDGGPWTTTKLSTYAFGLQTLWRHQGETCSDPPQAAYTLNINSFYIDVEWSASPASLTLNTTRLELSTGDTNRLLSTTYAPGTSVYTPTFTVANYSNPNSSCTAQLQFQAGTGQGGVNSVVTAGVPGCSRVAAGVKAWNGAVGSTQTGTIVVPPQIMIRTIIGEAGGQPDDVDQLAILVSARNRFGDRDFPGGRTSLWQDVLIPAQYYGASDPTTTGPEQELRNAAAEF